MTEPKWLDQYSGESAEQLIALAGKYRIDSILAAFEQALQQKASRDGEKSLSAAERTLLAVEALEREVNNGGYSQFFFNSSVAYVPEIVASLRRIGCSRTSEITERAIAALGLPSMNALAIQNAMADDNDEREDELGQCDDLYYNSDEDIEGRLFAFIKANHAAFELT
jgi:Domain of unknown function (DUF4375)